MSSDPCVPRVFDPRKKQHKAHTDQDSHTDEPPKFHKEVGELSTDIERWTYFLQNGNELDPDNLPAPLATPAIRLATEVLEKMSHNTLERHQYEARQRFLRDQATDLAIAEERGEARGELNKTRGLILRIGTKRLGVPPEDVVLALNGITNLDRLDQMVDRILDCQNWNSLLEGTSE